MLNVKPMLVIAGLALCCQSFALVNCDDANSVLCIRAVGAGANHYVRMKTNTLTSPVFCEDTKTTMNIQLTDEDIDMGISMKALHLGANDFEYIQCDDQQCEQPLTLGRFHFTLTKDANGYQATPAHFEFSVKDYGKTCVYAEFHTKAP